MSAVHPITLAHLPLRQYLLLRHGRTLDARSAHPAFRPGSGRSCRTTASWARFQFAPLGAKRLQHRRRDRGRVLNLRMTEQYLDRSYITGGTIDHCGFRWPEGWCAVFGFSQADRSHPLIDQACILPRAHMANWIDTAWR